MQPRSLYLLASATWFFSFGMQAVVFTWLVTMVLHEPAVFVGWAQTAVLAPGMLLILLAGAMADRMGADRQALLAQLLALVAPWILIVALQMGVLSFAVMVFYALLMGTAQAFVTPARDGLLNHVAGDAVQRTVLLTSLVQFGGQILGYVLAGYADAVGAEFILMLQSVVLAIGVLAYVAIRRSGLVQPSTEQTSVKARMLEGATTVWRSPVMRVIVFQNVAMACFFMGCFIVSFPLVLREVFNGSSADLAILNGFNSLGLVLTILILLRIGYVHRPGRALLLFQGLGALVLIAAGLAQNFILFVLAIFIWGMCGGVAMPMSRTLMQELAPPAQRSRVMSFYAFSFMGAGPLGTVFCGYLAASIGPQMAIVVCGIAMATCVLFISLFTSMWRERFEPGASTV